MANNFEQIFYHGKPLPLVVDFHHLKKSRLEIKEDRALATLCYDLSSKQQLYQLQLLIEKLYRKSTQHIIEETMLLLRNFAPRSINGIRYKKMRSRWGSASVNNNLNFNIDLAKLPLHLQQYVAIHEYCHLFEMNHSPKFWAKVAEFNPRYRDHRRELRRLEKSWRNH
jgi:predicted metal-dependent hydrolase